MSIESGVYQGLRVLDMSTGVAGPMATMLLADCGADVIRIENREAVDLQGASTGARVWNRGKRSVVLDLDCDEGRAELTRLVRSADLLVESLAPGRAELLGVDQASSASSNPRLITCSITGYGPLTELGDRPGVDALVAARTGLLHDQKGRRGAAFEFIAGRPGPHPEFDGPEGLVRGADRSGPVFPRSPWPSIGAAYFAAVGIGAALRAREVTGRGQRVETSLLQGALAAACLNWQRVEDPDAPLYWMWPIDARAIEGLYECADGRWVHHWTVRPNWVFESAEAESLTRAALDGAYRDDPDRVSMEADGLLTGIFLHPLLVEAFKKFPADEWVEAAEAAGVGVAPVRSPAEALMDESFLADGCVVRVQDPEVGAIRHAGPLLEFSASAACVRGPAPRLGEHTATVLAETTDAPPAPAPSGVVLAHALSGIRVIDLGLGVAGPFTGRVLADLGADVIKVNALHDTYWNGTHMGLGTNRGKRSIALNLKGPAGRAILEELIASADVVTTNWRPGAAARLALGWESLHERYPRLVWCNTRGYEKGPRSALPGTDQTAAALTGTEWEDGACDAGNPPLWSRSNMGDTGNALLAAIAILGALYHRERTGEGQAVSTSIVNAGLLHTSYAWVHDDGTPADWGHVDREQHGLSPWHRLYQCADGGWLMVVAASQEERRALVEIMLGDRTTQADERIDARLEVEFARDDAETWFARLAPSVPVEVVDEMFCRRLFDDEAARRAQLIAETHSAHVGRFEDPGLLVQLSETPGVIQRGPAACGEHTREILRELGRSDLEVDELVSNRVVLDAGGGR